MEEYDRGREQMHHHRVGLEVQVEAEYEQADQRENDQNESGTRVEVGEYGGQQENECGENEERVLTRRQYVELFDVEVNDEAQVDQTAQYDRPFPGEEGHVLVERIFAVSSLAHFFSEFCWWLRKGFFNILDKWTTRR